MASLPKASQLAGLLPEQFGSSSSIASHHRLASCRPGPLPLNYAHQISEMTGTGHLPYQSITISATRRTVLPALPVVFAIFPPFGYIVLPEIRPPIPCWESPNLLGLHLPTEVFSSEAPASKRLQTEGAVTYIEAFCRSLPFFLIHCNEGFRKQPSLSYVYQCQAYSALKGFADTRFCYES